MKKVRFKPGAAGVRGMSPEEAARLDAKSEAQIEAAARGDADNPPMSDEEWARARTRWLARKAREAAGLSQAKFAQAYHLNVRTLQGWEAGRFTADSGLMAYLQVILREPVMVRLALTRGGDVSVDETSLSSS